MYKVIIDHNPSQSDNGVVKEALIKSYEAQFGERDKKFSVFLKSDSGKVVGGIQAMFDSEAIYIEALWVEEILRKQGYGKKLLAAAEGEAIENGCRFSLVDTWDFQAEEFYLKNGYEKLGELKNYWHGHSKLFLRKKLNSSGFTFSPLIAEDTGIQRASTKEQIQSCYGVMRQLRPHLTEEQAFLEQVQRQFVEGYHLVYWEDKGDVKALAGFRFLEFLAWGKVLYIDDLITGSDTRRNGYGGKLLKWVIEQGKKAKCNQVHLDSGPGRHDAHRLYLNHGFKIIGHHFALDLQENI